MISFFLRLNIVLENWPGFEAVNGIVFPSTSLIDSIFCVVTVKDRSIRVLISERVKRARSVMFVFN